MGEKMKKLARARSMMGSLWGRLFLSVFLLFLVCVGAEAASRRNREYEPFPTEENTESPSRIASFEFHQTGAADLAISVSGKRLPTPGVVHREHNTTQVRFRKVSGKGMSKEHRENMAPMVQDVYSEQVGEDFIVTFITDKPIQQQTLRSVAPSDSYVLRFTTAEHRQARIEEPVKTHQPQTLQVPTGPFAVNTPITLDLRDADLRDVFRLIAMQLKKNIIIDDSIPPGQLVTMTVKNEPLSRVYAYLMKAHDLTYEMLGNNTIIIGTTAMLSKLSGKVKTQAYRIAYATPGSVAGLLPRMTKITTEGIVVDERLRTLYATAAPDVLEEVAIAIQRLDHPGPQVMLYARILEFNDNNRLEVETALNGIFDHWWGRYAQGRMAIGAMNVDKGSNSLPGYSGLGASSIPSAPLTGTTGLSGLMEGAWRLVDGAFSAMETKSRAKTLANPSVITIDGQQATIDLSQDFPYISGRDDAGNAQWSTMNIGPQLVMTPRVGRGANNEKIVTLDLQLRTSDQAGEVQGSLGETMPIRTQRSVTTTVRVRDGEPFVVGGLFSENKTNNTLRIPILGQLPLLGELFSYKTRSVQKSQVVMLVIPYILDTPDTAIEQSTVMLKQ
jgi:type IV pilus assembly protein PilQ